MVKNLLAVTVSILFIIGFISNVVSEIYFGEFDDICLPIALLIFIGTWLYVKIEQVIKKGQD